MDTLTALPIFTRYFLAVVAVLLFIYLALGFESVVVIKNDVPSLLRWGFLRIYEVFVATLLSSLSPSSF